jgi:hypothetical protein
MINDMRVVRLILSVVLSISAFQMSAQKLSVSTNVLDWSSLGTFNGEASYALGKHWSVGADAKYNPFSYGKRASGKRMQARQQSYSAGTRYWPWHIYSGWWLSGKIRYQEYNVGGILSEETVEGDRFGGGVGLGYTYMLHPHFNLEFGAGVWMGYGVYTKYRCPVCGPIEGKGEKFFILPSDAIIALAYVF